MPKKQFKAESKRLLDLMINSIYTNKEIFLREVISNASDALDKLCYKSLSEGISGISRSDLAIDIALDKEKRTITVSDNGIGMTRDELESNLGTIARSGSLQFRDSMEEAEAENQNIDIIGQFGVGFYSAFMVSSKVTVLSRAYGMEEASLWVSEGADGYSITSAVRESAGTDVIMQLKEDTDDENYTRFLQEYTIEGLIKKYSDYIRFPIRMEKTKYLPAEEGKEPEETRETATLNTMVPIWQRSKSELKDEDYENYYKEKFFDYEAPLLWSHVDAEGAVSYKALLYIPSKASYDYYTRDYKKGLQLYSSGVLIMESCEDLLPEHFRFARGVVDSPDLSLNISREMLQGSREVKVISSNIEKKIKNELAKLLSDNREKYETFYKAFGMQLKYGVAAEFGRNKDLLQDLLLFPSSKSEGLTTLSEYVSRMQPEQKYIYFATGDNVKMISSLPQLEAVLEKDYEVLYFTDEVDEFVARSMHNYNEKDFKSVNSDDEPLDEEQKKEAAGKEEENKSLLDFIKETLGDRVKEVKLTQKLKNHPVCLTASGGLSFEMEKYLNAMQPETGAKADRILELNPNHPLFGKLWELYSEDRDKAAKYAQVLYNQSLLMAGLSIDDPSGYSEMVFGLLN